MFEKTIVNVMIAFAFLYVLTVPFSYAQEAQKPPAPPPDLGDQLTRLQAQAMTVLHEKNDMEQKLLNSIADGASTTAKLAKTDEELTAARKRVADLEAKVKSLTPASAAPTTP